MDDRQTKIAQTSYSPLHVNVPAEQQFFSNNLERKGKLEMGQKFSGLLQSAPGFLSMGVMAATLKDEGIVPVIREECII